MSRLTLGQAISKLGDMVVSGTSVFPPGSTDAQKAELINQVNERFICEPSWKGVDGVARFSIYGNTLTLPRELSAIKKGGALRNTDDPDSYCTSRVPVRNQWYQFSGNGPGIWESEYTLCRSVGLMDLGDGWVSYRDPVDPFKLRVYTDVAETGNITLTGFNTSGAPLYSGTTLGVTLDLSVAGATTTAVFGGQSLLGVIKPVTNGRVLLFAVDNVTGNEIQIAVYQPSETVPSYRRYQVTGVEEEERVYIALCKRAVVNAVVDNDLLIPGNLGALKLGLMALNYETTDDGRRKEYWDNAVALLNGELAEYQADVPFSGALQTSAYAGGYTVRNAR
jgi:hypothetical protein